MVLTLVAAARCLQHFWWPTLSIDTCICSTEVGSNCEALILLVKKANCNARSLLSPSAGGVEGRAPAVTFAAQVRSILYSLTPYIESMGWPHCFKKHQDRADTRQAPQREQQDTPSEFMQSPSLAHVRPEPSERDKQSAEALKKEGNTYFGKAKYGAAIEVHELL